MIETSKDLKAEHDNPIGCMEQKKLQYICGFNVWYVGRYISPMDPVGIQMRSTFDLKFVHAETLELNTRSLCLRQQHK